MNTDQVSNGSLPDAEAVARSKIGRHVTYFALAATAGLGVVAICVALTGDATNKEKFIYVKDVLTIVLPLMGTWVGTVLAFYFSRENFAAAAKQSAELVRQLSPEQRLESIAVSAVMLDMGASTTLKLSLSGVEDLSKYRLKADIVDALMEKHRRNRLPIVDNSGKILYVIHRSYLDQFLVKCAESGGTRMIDVTLKDLLEAEELKSIFISFAVVGKEARMITVKQAMDGNANCSDAFVTEDGTKGSRALGWITNVMVREKAIS
jgi:hypothetical protein